MNDQSDSSLKTSFHQKQEQELNNSTNSTRSADSIKTTRGADSVNSTRSADSIKTTRDADSVKSTHGAEPVKSARGADSVNSTRSADSIKTTRDADSVKSTRGVGSLLKRFISYYKPYRGLFIADLFFALIQALTAIAFPYLIRYLINEVFVMSDLSLIGSILTRTAILMFVLYVVEAVATYFVSSWGHILGARIESDMRRDLFMHMERLSF